MKKTILAFLLLLTYTISKSQCNNVDFEMGDFTGWQGSIGVCCPINLTVGGIFNGRQTIMTGPGTDPITCNQVPFVSPSGGNFSARLGNSDVNAEAEGLTYTFVVSVNSSLFTYQYAVIFEDPGHLPQEQPRFETRVRLSNGQIIPCTEYVVTAASNLPGFQTCMGINWMGNLTIRTYRNWTTIGVDLSAYVGQSVTVEFKTGDCSLGGHFGQSQAILNAPIGFDSYQWSTGDTTRTIIVDPSVITQAICTITSFSGCVVNLVTNLVAADPIPSFTSDSVCLGVPTSFTNGSTSTYSPIASYFWDFGDFTNSMNQNPIHIYTQPGQYQASLTVTTLSGCIRTITQNITVFPLPNIQVNNSSVCVGGSALLIASGGINYSWSPPNFLNYITGNSVISTPTSNITYTITGIDQFGCINTTASNVIVNFLPVISLISHN